MIDLRLLIKNGVHFGHQTSRWSPKMEPYIWGYKNGIHLIDVMKTAHQLEKAAQFLESVAAEGRTILLVGTKKAAQESIHKVAVEHGLPFVMHRWVGGTFTNYRQVRKAIANLTNYEETLDKSEASHYTKKELNLLKKRAGRLDNIVGGIRNLSWPVGAVVVVDVKKESVVVKEALVSGIPVVGIVDTNSDPSHIDYVIPANDDSPRSITLLVDYLGDAIARGQKVAAKRPKKEVEIVETLVETLYEEAPEEGAKPKKVREADKEKAKPVKAPAKAKPVEKKVPDKKVVKKVEPKPKAPVKAPKKAEPKKVEVKKPAAKKEVKKAAPKKPAAKPKATKAAPKEKAPAKKAPKKPAPKKAAAKPKAKTTKKPKAS